METKVSGFLDPLTDDYSDSDNKVVETITRMAALDAQRTNFKDSVSVEAYHNRGFIKDGELIANYLKEGEQRNNITQLVVDNWASEHGSPVESKTGIITMYGEEGNIGLYILTAETTPGVEEIEQQLLKAISNYPENFNDKRVDIYVFAPFKDAVVGKILNNEYYEFRGRFEFIHTMRGWVLLQYHKAILLPVSKDK